MSISLNDTIGLQATRLDIGDSLQAIARRNRQEYIDYIGKLGESENNTYWWLTSISEKNPFISNIFLYSCYLLLVADLIEKDARDLVIICDSPGLMSAIVNNFQDNKAVRLEYYPLPTGMDDFRHEICRLKNTAIFLTRWMGRVLLANLFRIVRTYSKKAIVPEGKLVLIHSWTDRRSFRVPGHYEDVFLGRLGPDLRKKQPGVYFLIDVLPTLFFPVALYRLLRTDETVLILEEFLTPWDIISSVYQISTHFPKLENAPRFMMRDIAPILTEELETDRRNFRAFQTYLNYLAGKKISRVHAVQSFIYSFENLMWEKLFCVAFREFSPETLIIGYAHSTISTMETFYSVSSYEKPLLPLPDIIAVNGTRARDALINSGFNLEQVIIGGAYRYHALDISPRPPRDAGNKNTILIIPTDDFDSTLEFVTKAVHAFGNKTGIACIIKLHPTLPRKKISAYLAGIPENFCISEEPIERLLGRTDLVVYTGSTVAIEAIARGISILHVRSDLIIDRDIFNEQDHIVSVSLPEEMYRASMKILNREHESNRAGSDFVREFFEPVNEDVLLVFLAHKH